MGQGNVYRGASNGCDLNCCTCYNQSNPGVCCVDYKATVFPQGTGLAATFNAELAFAMGRVSADESRALQHNGPKGKAKHVEYRTGASSVINILRDVRWGRAPETYGEDPWLTGEIASAFNKALMGFVARNATAPEFGHDVLKIAPVIRHFVGYAGPDGLRNTFSATISQSDLRNTFFPAWKRLIEEQSLGGVMSAISAVGGTPSVANRLLLDVLRTEWGFDGFVISDCDTVGGQVKPRDFDGNVELAAVSALEAGGDINCGPEYAMLLNATKHGVVKIEAIKRAARNALRVRMRLGDLNELIDQKYTNIPLSVVDSVEHRAVATQVVQQSIVLLRNDDDVLPFNLADPALLNIAVIGPSANDTRILGHTYHGTPSKWYTPYDGVLRLVAAANERRAVRDTIAVAQGGVRVHPITVTLAQGCTRCCDVNASGFPLAEAHASEADAIIVVVGLEAIYEEEDTDRGSLALPHLQLPLIINVSAAAAAGAIRRRGANATRPPLAVVIISGGPISEPALLGAGTDALVDQDAVDALLWLSYPGQAGDSVADILFGVTSPSGRLPFTIPRCGSDRDLPLCDDVIGTLEDYRMWRWGLPTEAVTVGRTYRFADWSHPDSNATWPPFCVPTQPYTPQHVSHQRRIDIVPHLGEPYGRDSFAPHQPLRSKDVTAAPSLPWLHQHWGTERKSGFHGPPFAPFGFGMSYAKIAYNPVLALSVASSTSRASSSSTSSARGATPLIDHGTPYQRVLMKQHLVVTARVRLAKAARGMDGVPLPSAREAVALYAGWQPQPIFPPRAPLRSLVGLNNILLVAGTREYGGGEGAEEGVAGPEVEVSFTLDMMSDVLGAMAQAMPANLSLWVGDAMHARAVATVTVALE